MIIIKIMILLLYFSFVYLFRLNIFKRLISTNMLSRYASMYLKLTNINDKDPNYIVQVHNRVNKSKLVLLKMIEDCWFKIRNIVPLHILPMLEDELTNAISLIILASIKRSAEESISARELIKEMLNEADSNHDGQLSYYEWYNWLTKSEDNTLNTLSTVDIHESIDPMIMSLTHVFGHATSTLKVVMRMTSDPNILSASFIAGGISAGILDETVCKRMLSRLSTNSCELVLHALALESSSLSIASPSSISQIMHNNKLLSAATTRSSNTIIDKSVTNIFTTSSTSNIKQDIKTNTIDNSYNKVINDDSIIMTVDMSSSILVSSIASNKDYNLYTSSSKKHYSNPSIDSNDYLYDKDVEDYDDITNDIVTSKGTIIHNESIVEYYHLEDIDIKSNTNSLININNNNQNTIKDVIENEIHIGNNIKNKYNSIETSITSITTNNNINNNNNNNNMEGIDDLIDQITTLMEDATQMRNELIDLDDSNASQMRQLLYAKSMHKQEILGLSLAVRAARLQNINQQPIYIRHQLSLETLQLWAPLSFQSGLSNYIPELEVYSYVHLFSKSFGSFITWYGFFRPIAKKLIREFRINLEAELIKDASLSNIFSNILIQSRLKTPPSAFKKMLNGAKVREQLYDILGIRIIATMRQFHGLLDGDINHHILPNYNNNNTTTTNNNNNSSSNNNNNNKDYIINEDIIINPSKSNKNVISSISNSDYYDFEYQGLLTIRDIISNITDWNESLKRYKDYIKYPKRSGYQSLHMSIQHEASKINMEIQIRSNRMHWIAEYGSASHSNYKGLILPSQTSNS